MRFAVSNPGSLLIYGNPAGKKPKNQGKKPMATKTRKRRKARSAKQRANDKRLGAMARARHRGVTTKVRAKRRKRRAHKRTARAVMVAPHAPARRSKSRRRGRRAGRRAKHRAKGVRRGRSRGRHRRARRAHRSIFANPALTMKRGLADYFSGFSKVGAHWNAASGNGIKGYAAAGAGMVGTVFAGTLLARLIMPTALKMAPSVFGTPMGARALSFGMYYTGGWAIAKFTPGLSQKTRDAIMFGALAASVLEIVKPGIIALGVSKIPVVGEMIAGHLDGIESELSDYVAQALNGMGAVGFTENEYDGSRGFHGHNPGGEVLPGQRLSDIARYDMAGVGDYANLNGVGRYDMAGLGCPADDGSAGG
jgi:hypothetical protein